MIAECHAHLFMDGISYPDAVAAHCQKPDEARIRANLDAYRQKGVSYIRDGGDPYGVSLLAKKLAPEYGITLRTPGYAIHHVGHYGKIVGLGYSTPKEYHSLVLKLKAQGGDFVKIMTHGIMDFDTDGSITGEPLPKEEVRELIHIAHEEGLAVMVHVNDAKPVIWAAEAGADSIEHGNYLNAEAVSCLADCGTIFVPTMVTVANLIGSGRFQDSLMRKILEKKTENLLMCKEAGVLLARGSDAGAFRVLHGQGILDEAEIMRKILGTDAETESELQRGDLAIIERFCTSES